MLNKEAFISITQGIGYTATFNPKVLSCKLTSPNKALPIVDAFWPDEGEPGFDCRLRVAKYPQDKQLANVLAFITRFNWDCLTGKLLYNMDNGEIVLQLYYHNEPEKLIPEDFAIDLLMSCHLVKAIVPVLNTVISGKTAVQAAIDILEKNLSESMERLHQTTPKPEINTIEVKSDAKPAEHKIDPKPRPAPKDQEKETVKKTASKPRRPPQPRPLKIPPIPTDEIQPLKFAKPVSTRRKTQYVPPVPDSK